MTLRKKETCKPLEKTKKYQNAVPSHIFPEAPLSQNQKE